MPRAHAQAVHGPIAHVGEGASHQGDTPFSQQTKVERAEQLVGREVPIRFLQRYADLEAGSLKDKAEVGAMADKETDVCFAEVEQRAVVQGIFAVQGRRQGTHQLLHDVVLDAVYKCALVPEVRIGSRLAHAICRRDLSQREAICTLGFHDVDAGIDQSLLQVSVVVDALPLHAFSQS